MSARRVLLRYAWIVGLREWLRWDRISPEARAGGAAFAGAVVAPFVVFVVPVSRLYWLVTGRRLPGPVGRLGTASYVFVNPFAGDGRPPEIRELLDRPEYNWEPGPGDIPRWFDLWGRIAQLVLLQRPRSIRDAQQGAHREHKPEQSFRGSEVGLAAGDDEVVGGLAEEVVRCAERTLAADGVKIEWRQDRRAYVPPTRSPRRRDPLSPVRRLAWRALKTAWERVTGDFRFGHTAAKGVLEPSTGRYMLDYGSFAEIHDGRQMFGGRSGRPLATLGPFPTEGWTGALMWLLHLMRGTTHATEAGDELLHGTPCKRLAVHCDLKRAAAATRAELPAALADRLKRYRRLPVTVWVDGDYVRRVRLTDVLPRELTLELWDYGIATEAFDWSRLPTFKSPHEHAFYAGEHKAWHHTFLPRRHPR